MVQLHIIYSGSIGVGSSRTMTTVLPTSLRPIQYVRGLLLNNIDEPCGQCVVSTDGKLTMWVSSLESQSMVNLHCSCAFITS